MYKHWRLKFLIAVIIVGLILFLLWLAIAIISPEVAVRILGG